MVIYEILIHHRRTWTFSCLLIKSDRFDVNHPTSLSILVLCAITSIVIDYLSFGCITRMVQYFNHHIENFILLPYSRHIENFNHHINGTLIISIVSRNSIWLVSILWCDPIFMVRLFFFFYFVLFYFYMVSCTWDHLVLFCLQHWSRPLNGQPC